MFSNIYISQKYYSRHFETENLLFSVKILVINFIKMKGELLWQEKVKIFLKEKMEDGKQDMLKKEI